MSLLCVTVRRARLVGSDAQFNSYVTLKLQNVKSTTVTVKGCNPNWEQDFMFETNRMDTGLIIELWNKGLLWDKMIGNHWMPLMGIQFATEVGEGQWLSLDAELELINGEVCGTHTPTGHMLLLEAHFEPPYEFQIDDVGEFSRKLELLNTYMEQEMVAWNQEQRSRVNHSHQLYSGLSEDSDYTSDVSYPIQQHPSITSHHPNSSSSHFGGPSNLTRRALDVTDKDYNSAHFDGLSRDESLEYQNESSFEANHNPNYYTDPSNTVQKPYSEEPLSYNSRPQRRTLPQISDKSVRNFPHLMNSNNYIQSIYNFPNNQINTNDVHNSQYINDNNYQSLNDTQQMPPNLQSARLARRRQAIRKPSLERQGGFEDFEENYGSDHQKQYNNYEGRYDRSAQMNEQFYSMDDSFRQDSYDSYNNSLEQVVPLEDDMSSMSANNFNHFNNSTQDLQRNNIDISAGPIDRNNELLDNHFQTETFWTRKNSDKKKEQWKSSAQSESTIWQTVSEEDHFEDSAQFKDEKQSPQFFTPKSSIDQTIDNMIERTDNNSFGRQSTEETIPVDDLNNKVSESLTAMNGSLPQLPPHSAIKSDNKPSGEPKTVTFSDDIHQKTPTISEATFPSMMTSSLTTSLSTASNPEGLSRARVRWIAAFNKITSEFSEQFLIQNILRQRTEGMKEWVKPILK